MTSQTSVYHVSTGLHPGKAGGCFTVMRVGETGKTALAEAGCYGFLEPVAAQAVDAALDRCPEAAPLIDDDARRSMRDLCLRRLGTVYERPLLKLALGRASGTGAPEMLRAACAVRDEVMADTGASLRACLPLAIGYEQAIAANLVDTLSELLERLLLRLLSRCRPKSRLFSMIIVPTASCEQARQSLERAGSHILPFCGERLLQLVLKEAIVEEQQYPTVLLMRRFLLLSEVGPTTTETPSHHQVVRGRQ